MKKKFLFLMALLAVSLLALAEMTIFVYQKDGAKVEYLAANVDSIGFVNFHTIVFDANGGDGSMDALRIKESESVNLPANIFTKSAFAFTGWNTAADGSGTAYTDKATVKPTANMTLYAQWLVPEHEYVDLGLPSGLLWATMNVGADSPEDYGDYFAWGETEPKDEYDSFTYKWCNVSVSTTAYTKYCTSSSYGTVDNKTTLDLADDAANANWGGSWRMPTKAEQDELRTECTWTWTTLNGVKGYKVKSKINGKSIFLPAAGYRYYSSLTDAGSFGFYWGSSLRTDIPSNACVLGFNSSSVDWTNTHTRYNGQSVRPVIPKFYSITFDSNEGTGSMDVFKIKYLGSDVLPKNEFIREGYFFYGWNTKADGTGTHYVGNETISLEADMTLYAQWAKISEATTTSGHEWVDLGLPSGTRWATCNIGASQPEIVGSYLGWSYQAYGGTSSNPQTASLSSDLAYKNWGSDWRMPTKAEQDELANDSYTDWYAYTLNGVDGYLIISKINGNNIFLPKAESGTCGYECSCGYWNSSVYKRESNDWYQYYYISYMVGKGTTYRDISYDAKCTRQVRPVLIIN